MQKIMVLTALLIVMSISGCIDDSAEKAVKVLDEGIFKLDNANADWQRILEETRDKLTDSTQSTIRNEVSNALARGVAATGVEFRCDTDFVRTRVRQDLIRIRAGLLGETPPAAIPALCQVVPSQVDLSLKPDGRNVIVFSGYDFDTVTRPSLFLKNKNGALANVSSFLSITHHYQMTLNTGGNGVPLSLDDTALILKWANLTLSEVPIIGPKCEVETVQTERTQFKFIPPHIGGNAEFGGQGPDVTIKVEPVNHIKYITASIYMKAFESNNGDTKAEGSTEVVLYRAPPGYNINDINAKADYFSYKDFNIDPDIFYRGSGLVQKYEIMGDTPGADAGDDTGVTVYFNPFDVVRSKEGNCIP
jgi:hypothetical protein